MGKILECVRTQKETDVPEHSGEVDRDQATRSLEAN